MNVFIIGPEGAGKTVFVTMLNEYVHQHPETGIVFRAADFQTKKYLSGELKQLRGGDWPTFTKPGTVVSLNWNWDYQDMTSDVTLTDQAGHDIRRELCGESNELKILDKIKSANLLILLVDLFGHQKENSNKQVQNGWIVEHVLNNLSERQRVIFAVTKADMLTGSLPRKQWGNRDCVLNLVRIMMPEFNLPGYEARLRGDNCNVLAFSSVAATENREEQGTLVRVPKSPLASEGINLVLDKVVDAWRSTTPRLVSGLVSDLVSSFGGVETPTAPPPLPVQGFIYCVRKVVASWRRRTERKGQELKDGNKKKAFVIAAVVGLPVVAYLLYWCVRSAS